MTVVEAGPDPSDPHVHAQISDGLRLPIGDGELGGAPLRDDADRRAAAKRRRSCGVRWSAGRAPSTVATSAAVCPTDFDCWSLPGWTWDDVLPHFLAIETDLDFDGPLHGSDGPMTIRRVTEFDEGAAAFVEAARELGYAWIDDLNGADGAELPGVGAVPLNIDGGTRVGPGGAFLGRAVGRPNLTVLEKTRVVGIRIAGGRAVGVDCVGPDGSDASTRRSNRAVRRCNWIRTPADGVGHRAGSGAARVGDPGAGGPAGRDPKCADHPEWVLPVDWPAAPGRPPLEAVLTTVGRARDPVATPTGFGAMTGGRATIRPTGRTSESR